MNSISYRLCSLFAYAFGTILMLGVSMSYWATAQQESNIWYFGAFAGVDFNSGSPTALTNGNLNTEEACATMCDPQTGDLLFYTDGITVWDATHNIMPNGSGLWGHPSTTQTAIVPHPGDTDRYYIFTAPSQVCATYSCPYDGLAYSVVDMAMNGGLGDVIIKNQPLYAPTTEKIAVARHTNCRDYWLISHRWNSNLFYVFKIDTNGLDTNAVTSSTGLVHSGSTADNFEAIGYMKASTDYQQVALAVFSDPGPGIIELFDFNNATGVLSNPLSFSPGGSITSGVYGVSFSPDNTKLYVSTSGDLANTAHLLQYDLTAGFIPASQNIIQSTNNDFGALQLAPDGKIYLARPLQTHLGGIDNPNADANSLMYEDSSVALSNRWSNFGLPNNIFPPIVETDYPAPLQVCEGDAVFFKDTAFTLPHGFTWALSGTVYWDFGDGGWDTTHQPIHVYDSPATYDVTLIADYPDICFTDTVTKSIEVVPRASLTVSKDDSICHGDTVQLNALGGAGYTFSWAPASSLSDSSVANPLAYPDSTTHFVVTAENIMGCRTTDSIKITVYPLPVANFTADPMLIQEGESIAFTNESVHAFEYEWTFQDGATSTAENPTQQYDEQGAYEACLYAYRSESCYDKHCDSIRVKDLRIAIGVPNAFTPNKDGENDVLYVEGTGIVTMKLQVFNRWGELLFETSDPDIGWDGIYKGQPQEQDVYVWQLTATLLDGERVYEKGNVTLLR